MSKVRLIRQGDVPLVILDSKPNFTTEVETDRKLVRKGEHGGVHQLADLSKARIVEDRGSLEETLFGTYVHVLEPTELEHTTSHAPLPLEPGWYQVLEQREWVGSQSFRVQD